MMKTMVASMDVAEFYSPPRVTSMANKWDYELDGAWT